MYTRILEKYFNEKKDEFIDDILNIVRINSEKGEPTKDLPYGSGPKEALDLAMKLSKGFGFKVTNYDNYVCAIDFGEKERHLDILAHLDIVPGGDGWSTTTPFEPKIIDNKIYGRGTSDDKGPAIAALYAMRAIKDLNIPLSKNVRLILGCDEECGSSDLEYYYSKEAEAPMSFTPDADFPVINIEKGRIHGRFCGKYEINSNGARIISFNSGTRANVVPNKAECEIAGLSKKDILDCINEVSVVTKIKYEANEKNGFLHISATGKNAHAAEPSHGNNALTGLITLLSRLPLSDNEVTGYINYLEKTFPHGDYYGKACGISKQDDKSGRTTIILSILNISDGHLYGEFDGRCCISSTKEDTCDLLINSMSAAKIKLDCPFRPPHYVPEDSFLVTELLNVYEKYTKKKGHPLAIGGGTYVHDLKNGVAFGCILDGEDTHMHGPDEFVNIDTLILSAKMFAEAIINLCR